MFRLAGSAAVLVLVVLLTPAPGLADPPTVSQPPDITVEATGPSTGVSYDVSSYASDDNGPPSVSCGPTSFSVGTTPVSCTATDTTTNETSSFGFNVTVTDTTPPTIDVSSTTVEATGPSGAAVSYSASATDLVDGSITPSCSPSAGSTFPLGSTTVNCSATDSHGNTANASFTVTVVDTTPPAISVPSDMTVEATGSSGATVSYSASAVDIVDGSVPVACAPASGSVFGFGSTTVTCSASDSHGNNGSASFNVNVVDSTPPTVTVPSNRTVEATGPSGRTVNFNASAVDNIDGPLPVTCAPASGSTFPLGSTTVTCSATDSHGNTGSASFTVNVVDTTPPTLTVPGPINVHAPSSSGIAVTYTATAVDIVDGPVTPSCNPASGSIFPAGTTTVHCTATDSHGNTASASFNVNVFTPATPPPGPAGPPTIVITGALTGNASGPPGVAVDFKATASDDGGAVPVTCTPASGSVFPVGKTSVTCTATGHSGASASKTFTVTVIDRTPAPAVTGLTTRAIDGGFVLTWRNPTSADFDHVEVFRTRLPSGNAILLYSGDGTTFTDKHATNSGPYRYTVFTVDASGNRNGVAIALHTSTIALVRPADGARVTSPPMLLWVPQGAAYYNIQLFRGNTKVLSVWPLTAHYALPRTWRFGGHSQRLQPGTYRWYVWPGIGSRNKHAFGHLLGSSSFIVSA